MNRVRTQSVTHSNSNLLLVWLALVSHWVTGEVAAHLLFCIAHKAFKMWSPPGGWLTNSWESTRLQQSLHFILNVNITNNQAHLFVTTKIVITAIVRLMMQLYDKHIFPCGGTVRLTVMKSNMPDMCKYMHKMCKIANVSHWLQAETVTMN